MTQTAVNFNSIYRGNYLFNQYGFRSNSLSTDNIISIRQTSKTKWEHIVAVQQLFLGFKKAYDSVMTDSLYNIIFVFVSPMKILILTQMCPN